jgi:hypothetical protein
MIQTPAYLPDFPDFTPPYTVGVAHPTQGVTPRYPHVSPANAIKEPRGPTETGQGNPVTKGPLQQAAKLLPRPPVDTYEGAASGRGDARGVQPPSAGRTRERPNFCILVYCDDAMLIFLDFFLNYA